MAKVKKLATKPCCNKAKEKDGKGKPPEGHQRAGGKEDFNNHGHKVSKTRARQTNRLEKQP